MIHRKYPAPIAAIGDRVRIIDTKNCAFGHNPNMDNYIGMEAIVKKQSWQSFKGAHEYKLDVDGGKYYWCEKCIELLEDVDIAESDASVTDLFV